MVEQLRASGQTSEQLTQLMEQLEAMTTTVDELMERNPNGQSDELNSEVGNNQKYHTVYLEGLKKNVVYMLIGFLLDPLLNLARYFAHNPPFISKFSLNILSDV